MTDNPDDPKDPPDFTPVPLKYYRHDGWTPERQRAFIQALARCGSVPNAARSIGMGAGRIYDLRNYEGAEEFRAAWDDAIGKATGKIHDVLVDHAVNGAPEPIMYGGEEVGEFRRFDHRLMMWLLSHHKPDQFSLDTAPALSDQRIKDLKKQWRAEWEAERQQKAKAAMEDYQKAKAKHQQEQEAKLHAKIEQLRQRMIAIYITKDPATGEPSKRFDPKGASAMELLVYDEVSGGTEGAGADGEDLGKEVRDEMGFGETQGNDFKEN